ncbi:MAG: molybdenum cofactor biosynthesis protein MoaE [Hydrogenobaculum sp.]|jgi:Molybdopterin converting factor, large subunit
MIPKVSIGVEFIAREEDILRSVPKEVGASLTFLGIARASKEDGDIVELFYEAHEPMALKIFHDIRLKAIKDFSLIDAYIYHKIGSVKVGEVSFFVLVLGSHRDEVYKGSRFIVDEVKKEAPIWKKEVFKDGSSKWVMGA